MTRDPDPRSRGGVSPGAASARRETPGATRGDEGGGNAAVYALAAALAALAGFVDATGYIHVHHLFVSFMSGNSTQAMVAAAQGDTGQLFMIGRTILLFVGGVTFGEIVGAASKRWGRAIVLALETLLLGAALAALRLGLAEGWIAAALALAMGVQNAAVHKAEGISVALTYVTGTLVHVGRGVAAALRGSGSWRAPLPFVGLWIALASGGLLGALVADRSLATALTTAAGAAAVLATVSLVVAAAGWRVLSAVEAPRAASTTPAPPPDGNPST